MPPASEEEEDEEETEIASGKGKKKVSKADLSRFQSIANDDGYYDDRRPLDEDTYFGSRRNIQWVPLLLGIGGIVLFVLVVLGIQSML